MINHKDGTVFVIIWRYILKYNKNFFFFPDHHSKSNTVLLGVRSRFHSVVYWKLGVGLEKRYKIVFSKCQLFKKYLLQKKRMCLSDNILIFPYFPQGFSGDKTGIIDIFWNCSKVGLILNFSMNLVLRTPTQGTKYK